jgi:hypothetical protein
MFRRLTLSATLGVLMLSISCAEAPKKEEAPAPAPTAAAVEEGPFYELTKDEITSHPDWTSKNITFKGAKIGDKGAATIEKALGKGDKDKLVEGIGEHYRTVYGQSSFAIYTYKNTAELQKIELFGRMADQIADPKFRKLLSTGDLKYMRDTFGMEDMSEVNSNTSGMEYIYDAKGFRFAEYNLPGQKVRSLIFSKIVPKKASDAKTDAKAPETK